MDNLNVSKELVEHFNSFAFFINDYRESQLAGQHLNHISHKLTEEIETLKQSKLNLTEQLQTLSNRSEEQENASTMYIELKGKYKNLQEKQNELLKHNAFLNEKYLLEKTELQENFFLEKNRIVADLTEKINTIENDNEQQKNYYLKKESDLYNELQLTQASNALQYDEMESRLQMLQLQLKESNQSCKTLREEYLSFKLRSNYDLEVANKHIQELKRKLQEAEEQLHAAQERLFSTTRNRNSKTSPSIDASYRKPDYLEVRPTNVYSSKNQNTSMAKSKATLNNNYQLNLGSTINMQPNKYDSLATNLTDCSKNVNQNPYGFSEYQPDVQCENQKRQEESTGSHNFRKNINGNSKSFVPPLKQISKPMLKSTGSKKRKLYNPGSYNLDDKD